MRSLVRRYCGRAAGGPVPKAQNLNETGSSSSQHYRDGKLNIATVTVTSAARSPRLDVTHDSGLLVRRSIPRTGWPDHGPWDYSACGRDEAPRHRACPHRRRTRAWLGARSFGPALRVGVRRSFITTTVRDESQVKPQGRHR